MGFEARFSPPFVSVAEFITVRFQPSRGNLRCRGGEKVSVAEFITVRFQRR